MMTRLSWFQFSLDAGSLQLSLVSLDANIRSDRERSFVARFTYWIPRIAIGSRMGRLERAESRSNCLGKYHFSCDIRCLFLEDTSAEVISV